jgi:phosphoglycerate dehydrogenase-like enzyme
MNVAFLGNPKEIDRVFAQGRRTLVESRAKVVPGVLSLGDPRLFDVQVIFSTWGMPVTHEADLDAMPNLKAVLYAAGTVSYFAKPFLDRGIQISSAWHANALPVAEFTLSQILLSCKGYFRNVREYAQDPKRGHTCSRGPGIYGQTVGLLGVGAVGAKVVELLRPFQLDVIVFDPYLTEERAIELGVRKVSLDQVFRESLIVSNHLLDVPETRRLIRLDHFESMPPGATFINTGRGGTIDTAGMLTAFRQRPDLTALLDVTDPEPLPPDDPLWALPNIVVSTHIAGAIGEEVLRLADLAIEEFDRFRSGQPLRYRVFG